MTPFPLSKLGRDGHFWETKHWGPTVGLSLRIAALSKRLRTSSYTYTYRTFGPRNLRQVPKSKRHNDARNKRNFSDSETEKTTNSASQHGRFPTAPLTIHLECCPLVWRAAPALRPGSQSSGEAAPGARCSSAASEPSGLESCMGKGTPSREVKCDGSNDLPSSSERKSTMSHKADSEFSDRN